MRIGRPCSRAAAVEARRCSVNVQVGLWQRAIQYRSRSRPVAQALRFPMPTFQSRHLILRSTHPVSRVSSARFAGVALPSVGQASSRGRPSRDRSGRLRAASEPGPDRGCDMRQLCSTTASAPRAHLAQRAFMRNGGVVNYSCPTGAGGHHSTCATIGRFGKRAATLCPAPLISCR